jgi:hypothetical protein
MASAYCAKFTRVHVRLKASCGTFRQASSPQVYRLQGSPLTLRGLFSLKPPRQITSPKRPKGRAERLGVVAARSLMRDNEHAHQKTIAPVHSRLHACVPHAMDFTACSMPQGLSLPPTLPVRANCRPDMHLDRLPVLPACVPQPLSRIVIPVGVWSPASWRTTASRCHATNTLAARPLTERDKDKIFLLGIKSKIKFAAVKQCE